MTLKAASHPKVLHWDDERSFGNGHIVTTAYGWAFDPDPDHNSAGHVAGFDTVKDAIRALRWARPCSCLRCTSKGKEA